MSFISIHTTYGLLRMAAAEASGVAINLTHMAVGDGNGNEVAPFEDQAQLIGEKYRATINRVFQDSDDPRKFTAELIVPASAAGFTLREVGVFDADGSLFVVGNLPPTYKPTVSEGAYADSVVRIDFLVTNVGVVNLMIDPNVAVVTQSWINNNITAANLIPGGTVNQLLAKAENADGKFKWVDPDAVSVTVDVIEEPQTLALNQTTVTLATTTTRGLAVYIEGVRLRKGTGTAEWMPGTGLDATTKVILGKSYPAGSKFAAVQNEPSGSASAPLEIARNLSDLENKTTARANLGVYSKEETDQKAPVGEVAHFARSTAPAGWLKMNGAAVSRTAYAELFSVLGTAYGAGDGFTTFTLPDARGEFIRGWDDARGVDMGRVMGTAQSSQNQAHSHAATTAAAGSHSHTYSDTDTASGISGLAAGPNFADRELTRSTGSAGLHTHAITVAESGGAEARPRNLAFLACIKF